MREERMELLQKSSKPEGSCGISSVVTSITANNQGTVFQQSRFNARKQKFLIQMWPTGFRIFFSHIIYPQSLKTIDFKETHQVRLWWPTFTLFRPGRRKASPSSSASQRSFRFTDHLTKFHSSTGYWSQASTKLKAQFSKTHSLVLTIGKQFLQETFFLI